MIKLKIIYKVYDYRMKANMTIRELAEKSEIGIATIDRIENGLANPTIEIICRLADALKCSPYDLFQVE